VTVTPQKGSAVSWISVDGIPVKIIQSSIGKVTFRMSRIVHKKHFAEIMVGGRV
jgi:hypothetical protein